MIHRVLIGLVALTLFTAIYLSVSFSRSPSTIFEYADVLGLHVTLKPLPTFIPPNQVQQASAPSPLPSPTTPPIQDGSMWEVIQNWRAEQGLPRYQTSARLCQIAQQRLSEIQKNWSHDGFSGARFCDQQPCDLSENLARRYSSEEQVLRGWLGSSSHAGNLYKPHPNACIATDGTYIVHIMGNL